MAKYIDAELVKQKYCCCGWLEEISEEEFNKIPAADVALIKHGRWKLRKSWDKYVCTSCSFEQDKVTNYCPNCGARMGGGI